tara:strand:- start:194 stop:313 length:120 start_codon:yes stop_codon:yes gene_type:complete
MIDLFLNIVQFMFIGVLCFACGWGLRDIYVNLKEYMESK